MVATVGQIKIASRVEDRAGGIAQEGVGGRPAITSVGTPMVGGGVACNRGNEVGEVNFPDALVIGVRKIKITRRIEGDGAGAEEAGVGGGHAIARVILITVAPHGAHDAVAIHHADEVVAGV